MYIINNFRGEINVSTPKRKKIRLNECQEVTETRKFNVYQKLTEGQV